MLPITEGHMQPRRAADLRICDDYLARVLEGDAFLLFDGAMGTMLQARGLQAGSLPELLCLTDPEGVTAVHAAYVEAGSQCVTTNTFGANARKLEGAATVVEIFSAAATCARASGARYVAADIGPTGALLEPLGTLSFNEAYDLFAEQTHAAEAAGADLIVIETMSDLLEMKAAVLAAKETTRLPIFATMTFGEDGRTFLGTDPLTAAITLGALGVSALGVNCSLGPHDLAPIVTQMLAVAPCPVMVQANAGLPHIEGDRTVYSIDAESYAEEVAALVRAGATIIGGCCGTDPSYISALAAVFDTCQPLKRIVDGAPSICSAQQTVTLRASNVAIIGERINPTGKKRLKQALRDGDDDYVIELALDQAEAGADVLDVNAGLPELDEPATLARLVTRIQGVCGLPLQIDSAAPAALESAARVYAGKPLLNSVNGKRESLDAVLPIAAHYGCAFVGLTLDESGIPETAEARLAIAERIVSEAERWGIPREDVFIDCLVMTASTNQSQIPEILAAVRLVKERLGVRTVLGVSNVSFGLPAREVINATFLAAAFQAGLDMPILNPSNERYAQVVSAWRLLCGQDAQAERFCARFADYTATSAAAASAAAAPTVAELAATTPDSGADAAPAPATPAADAEEAVRQLVISGRKAQVASAIAPIIEASGALHAINACLIPALDDVGNRFEAGTFFLPQLMAAAEAAKAGFDVARDALAADNDDADDSALKGPIALATVKGDIHDIGKNIVRMLLENYGYKVYDLGRDVDPQAVLDCVRAHNVRLVGLSALMTTTVASMAETIQLLHEQAPDVRVFVGGAVLNEEYAQLVGADFYTKDAAASARLAGEFFEQE